MLFTTVSKPALHLLFITSSDALLRLFFTTANGPVLSLWFATALNFLFCCSTQPVDISVYCSPLPVSLFICICFSPPPVYLLFTTAREPVLLLLFTAASESVLHLLFITIAFKPVLCNYVQ
jgi:hypothetical protein